MPGDGITAYDVPKRITTYDTDMDMMHPNRHKMLDVALEVLPFERDQQFCALDIRAGTGVVTKRILDAYPNAHVIAIDGARSMVEAARQRLGESGTRVEFRVGDFRNLDSVLAPRRERVVGNLLIRTTSTVMPSKPSSDGAPSFSNPKDGF